MKIKKIVIPLLISNKAVKCFRKDKGSFGISYKIGHIANKKTYEKLIKYKDMYEGESCFIVGTGPSLELDDVNRLKGKLCFGVNTLYKIYDKTDWRADYYCVIDPTTYSGIGEEVKKYHKDTLFIAGNRIEETDEKINQFSLKCSSFYKIPYLDYFETPCSFSSDLCNEIYDGASVVYAALQIAVYMGFKNIYLLGVDCNYNKDFMLHSKSLEYNKDYKYNWTQQTGLTMIEGFKVAKKYADQHGINIYNATRGGMLEVFPRIKLDDVVGETKL